MIAVCDWGYSKRVQLLLHPLWRQGALRTPSPLACAFALLASACALPDSSVAETEGASGTGDNPGFDVQGDCDAVPPEAAEFSASGATFREGERPVCRVRHHAIIERASAPFRDGVDVAATPNGASILVQAPGVNQTNLHLLGIHEDSFAFAAIEGGGSLSGRIAQRSDASLSVIGRGFGSGVVSHYQPGPDPWMDPWSKRDVFEFGFLREHEIDADGRLWAWVSSFDQGGFTELIGEPGGEWSATYLGGDGPGRYYGLDYDDQPIRQDLRVLAEGQPWQLVYTDESGEEDAIELPTTTQPHLRPATRPGDGAHPEGRAAPRVAVVRAGEDMLVVDREGLALTVPATPMLETTSDCPEMLPTNCEGTCSETGEGIDADAFVLADAADGSTWIAWIHEERELIYGYTELCSQECVCVPELDEDASRYRLELARISPAGELDAIMSLDLDELESPSEDDSRPPVWIRAYGDRLALGINSKLRVHLFEIDISA